MYIAPDEESLAAARESGIMASGSSGDHPNDWIAIGTLPGEGGYITTMHYNEERPWSIGVPSKAGGSSSTYAADHVSTSSGLRSVRLSDYYLYSTYVGAWFLNASNGPFDEYRYWSARLSFR